jgi:hypothetical protein
VHIHALQQEKSGNVTYRCAGKNRVLIA